MSYLINSYSDTEIVDIVHCGLQLRKAAKARRGLGYGTMCCCLRRSSVETAFCFFFFKCNNNLIQTRHSSEDWCLSKSCCCCNKIPNKNNLRGRLISAYTSGGTAHHGKEGIAAGGHGAWSHCIHSQKQKR